ncbi:hypothetical protein [Microbacterium terregens]|uniref:Uncharacterized protein n=1 Tax=Microbacterium terregens TaxID=69363 RepID=A0ABV5T402_9MICO
MTAISAPRTLTRATTFERALLRAASALDGFVATRLERRGRVAYRRAAETQARAARFRSSAQACGAVGLLPR